MNILLDDLPEHVVVDGKRFWIDTDFRTFIILEKILMDEEMEDETKVRTIMGLLFTDTTPRDLTAALNAVFDIYRCGAPPKKSKGKKKNGDVEIKQRQIYDYEYDAPYIYGAFMTQYGIDLNSIEYLHWWKFQALFKSLNSTNKIMEIMSYRAADLGEIDNQRERNRIARLQKIYALPQNLSREDKVAMAGAVFGGGFM